MKLLKSDIPYLLAVPAETATLTNGLPYELVWEYTLNEASFTVSFEGHETPIIAERVWRKHFYTVGDYALMVATIDEWQYLDHEDATYAETMLGYRGYWVGEIRLAGELTLQPEVALLLGYTPDYANLPAYLETISPDELLDILDDLQTVMANDDALAFSHPLPIGAAISAPKRVEDALRRMRAQSKILITRGRANGLKKLMERTGVIADNGGWRLLPEEFLRRQRLGIR